jgi:hypothetical protein
MELDFKVICLIIILVAYEYMIKRSILTFSKWGILGIFTIFSYATLSFIEHKDTLITDYTIFIISIILKTLFFTTLYIAARRSYYKLPIESRRKLLYEYGTITFLLIVLVAVKEGPELMNWPTIDQETGQDITIINHQGIGALMEVILTIFGIYIFIRNWIYLKIIARKDK